MLEYTDVSFSDRGSAKGFLESRASSGAQNPGSAYLTGSPPSATLCRAPLAAAANPMGSELGVRQVQLAVALAAWRARNAREPFRRARREESIVAHAAFDGFERILTHVPSRIRWAVQAAGRPGAVLILILDLVAAAALVTATE